MFMPTDGKYYYDEQLSNRLIAKWLDAAEKLSLWHGIFINVFIERGEIKNIKHIYFQLGNGLKFESLRDLKRALKMKALI